MEEMGKLTVELPPGFRFHPTDEEIITHYLFPKVLDHSFTCRAIGDVDLNRWEPWELRRKAKMTAGETKELYFFSHRDRKYPTGTRTNRATVGGYWKATGKDKEILKEEQRDAPRTASAATAAAATVVIGMKKTLVFYKGRAPKGFKTNWVMHEFRLEGKVSHWNLPSSLSPKDVDWVVCRIFHKTPKTGCDADLKHELTPSSDDFSSSTSDIGCRVVQFSNQLVNPSAFLDSNPTLSELHGQAAAAHELHGDGHGMMFEQMMDLKNMWRYPHN